MKKVILGFTTLAIVGMANELITAEHANKIAISSVISSFEKSYTQNKKTCDETMDLVNDQVTQAAKNGKYVVDFGLKFTEDGNFKAFLHNGYINSSCPLAISRYLIETKGYRVKYSQSGREGNVYISW